MSLPMTIKQKCPVCNASYISSEKGSSGNIDTHFVIVFECPNKHKWAWKSHPDCQTGICWDKNWQRGLKNTQKKE